MPEPESPSLTLFESPLGRVGRFRCPPGHARWTSDNVSDAAAYVVFPRVPVVIAQSGAPTVLADPTCTMFYNPWAVYRRELVAPRGDECEWFSPSTNLLRELVGDRSDVSRPFRHVWSRCPAPVYLLQRRVVEAVERGGDALRIEEVMLAVLRAAGLGEDDSSSAPSRRADTLEAHRDLVRRAKAFLATNASRRPSASEIAAAVHSSPFHLCRVFKNLTGSTMHEYLRDLSIRTSLERLGAFRGDLASLAKELGFASHAHFTSAFRRAFGVTPHEVATSRVLLRQAMRERRSLPS